ncbi:hypothetical protein ACOKM5_43855 [Streptomyces sp. BH097]|uniref:hypothetical protein n=1 Tax=unclassified Streptomyces TaxID=2593676 RepID=UPI003BB5B4CE
MTSLPDDTVTTEVTWCCNHAEHGTGAPPLYGLQLERPPQEPDFGCRHLTNTDRQALLNGTVPDHLWPEY